jgi:hypothetical protein
MNRIILAALPLTLILTSPALACFSSPHRADLVCKLGKVTEYQYGNRGASEALWIGFVSGVAIGLSDEEPHFGPQRQGLLTLDEIKDELGEDQL